MPDNSANNKRIAKNTLLLYVRLLFTMAVGLFTSRVILNTLGIDDYGVYNVVAGVVSMFSLLTGSLSNAISRYLTYNLGKGDKAKLTIVFSTSMNIMIGMSIIVAVLMEIGGVWFLNNHLNIPSERLVAANWVLQLSIATFVLGLVSAPYNAAIIAHERMAVFAYISMIDVVLKLLIVYMLYVSPYDKLITYAALFAGVAVLNRFIYGIYCTRNFEECQYHFIHDKSLLKEMTSFAGWNFLGSASFLFYTQGVNIATNMFFNVAINAARGVSNQVEGIIKQFVSNFTVSINPQITKSYAAGDINYTFNLVCKGSKYSFYLMLLFAVPFWFEADTILKWWLKIYPLEAPLFLRLSLIGTMIDLLGNSLANALWATGEVKKYYLIISPISLLVLPISCFLFWIGMSAYVSYIVIIVIYSIIQIVRLFIAKNIMNFPIGKYCEEVFYKIIPVSILSLIIPSVIFYSIEDCQLKSLGVIVLSFVSVLLCEYFFGTDDKEKAFFKNTVKEKICSKWLKF